MPSSVDTHDPPSSDSSPQQRPVAGGLVVGFSATSTETKHMWCDKKSVVVLHRGKKKNNESPLFYCGFCGLSNTSVPRIPSYILSHTTSSACMHLIPLNSPSPVRTGGSLRAESASVKEGGVWLQRTPPMCIKLWRNHPDNPRFPPCESRFMMNDPPPSLTIPSNITIGVPRMLHLATHGRRLSEGDIHAEFS